MVRGLWLVKYVFKQAEKRVYARERQQEQADKLAQSKYIPKLPRGQKRSTLSSHYVSRET